MYWGLRWAVFASEFRRTRLQTRRGAGTSRRRCRTSGRRLGGRTSLSSQWGTSLDACIRCRSWALRSREHNSIGSEHVATGARSIGCCSGCRGGCSLDKWRRSRGVDRLDGCQMTLCRRSSLRRFVRLGCTYCTSCCHICQQLNTSRDEPPVSTSRWGTLCSGISCWDVALSHVALRDVALWVHREWDGGRRNREMMPHVAILSTACAHAPKSRARSMSRRFARWEVPIRFQQSCLYPGSDVAELLPWALNRGPKPTATTFCAAPLSSSFTFEGWIALLAMSAEGVYRRGSSGAHREAIRQGTVCFIETVAFYEYLPQLMRDRRPSTKFVLLHWGPQQARSRGVVQRHSMCRGMPH